MITLKNESIKTMFLCEILMTWITEGEGWGERGGGHQTEIFSTISKGSVGKVKLSEVNIRNLKKIGFSRKWREREIPLTL